MLVIEYISPREHTLPMSAKVETLEEVYELDFIKKYYQEGAEYKIVKNLANQRVLWIVYDGTQKPIAFLENEKWKYKQ
jgi:hypothetical protein